MNVNKVFLFGLSQMGGVHGERRGIVEQHAYSIMEAKELDNFRLLKIRYAFPFLLAYSQRLSNQPRIGHPDFSYRGIIVVAGLLLEVVGS